MRRPFSNRNPSSAKVSSLLRSLADRVIVPCPARAGGGIVGRSAIHCAGVSSNAASPKRLLRDGRWNLVLEAHLALADVWAFFGVHCAQLAQSQGDSPFIYHRDQTDSPSAYLAGTATGPDIALGRPYRPHVFCSAVLANWPEYTGRAILMRFL